MIRLLLFLYLISQAVAVPAGLKVPTWHEGKILLKTTPEIHKEFQIDFELNTTFTELKNLKIILEAPENLKLIEGKKIHTIPSLSPASVLKKSWKFSTDREINGQGLRIRLEIDTPVENLQKEARELYSSEPAHQVDQLLQFIQGFEKRTQSYYSIPIFVFETEGLRSAVSLHFRKKIKLGDYRAPFITYGLPPLSQAEEKPTLLKLNQFTKFFEKLRLEPQARDATAKMNPGAIRRMLEDHSYLAYQLAFSSFLNKDYETCDQVLQNLTALLMTEAEFSYDFFLAIQNLRSLNLIAQGKIEKARNTLITSIRTEPNSKVRHYLQYNLANLYDQENNPAQRDHYLIEAIRSSPGFTLAKEMKNRSSGNQKSE